MNKVTLIGNIGKEPDIRRTTNDKQIANFSLAVRRKFKDQNGDYPTDWINIVCFGHSADFVSKYLGKGSKIAVAGSLQVRSWEKDGQTRYVTEVIADEIESLDKIQKQESKPSEYADDDTSLPFDV